MSRYAALALLAAAACSPEHAGSLPPLSSAPVTTPPVTVSASASPAADAAVRAAVTTYFKALGDAGRSGDTSGLARLLDPKCECRQQLEYVTSETRKGNRITTTYVVEAVRPHDVTPTTASAAVTFSVPASAVVDSRGHTVRRLAAARHVGFEIALRMSRGTWVIVRIVKLGA
jgi:hypothetical protein